jgi:hypothetical protein
VSPAPRARFRLDALTAVLAATIVLASACGSSCSTTAQLPTLQSLTNKALAYAQCMRSHGIPAFPDPVDKGSNIQIGPGPDSGIDMNSARFQAARKACIPLLPDGGP